MCCQFRYGMAVDDFAPCGRCFARFILSYVNNETQWRQRWLFIAQYSSRNHLFLRKFLKSLQVKRTNIYWRAKYILLLINCLRKPTLKGKNNSTLLIQWMKEDLYCLLFPLQVSTVLFGVNMYYFTEKSSVQRPKSKCISLCCVFNSFCTQKVHLSILRF